MQKSYFVNDKVRAGCPKIENTTLYKTLVTGLDFVLIIYFSYFIFIDVPL